MSNVERLSISLPPEMAASVKAAVEAGEYVSTSDVIRDALRHWQRDRGLGGYVAEDLRAMWQEGLESGPVVPGEGALDMLQAKYQGMADPAKKQ